jgi:hypothetical protein
MWSSTVAVRVAVATLVAAMLVVARPGVSAGGPRRTESPADSGATRASECVFCASYARHASAMHGATREVGALPNGVVIHLRCELPETVVELQKYTFEKQTLRAQYWARAQDMRTCKGCRDLLARLKGAHFEVVNSVHGVFTIITSSDPNVVRALHELASQETKEKGVRGS